MATLDEDWEEWTPEKGSFVNHMLAGSAAGVAEHVSIFPIDTIKTHMQCQRCAVNINPHQLTAIQTARQLTAAEGPLRLFRGVSTMLGASLPAHAVYFSVFEAAKKSLGADTNMLTPMASGSAGVIATVCHDFIMTPMDVVKQRLQLGYYKGVADCFKTVVINSVSLPHYCCEGRIYTVNGTDMPQVIKQEGASNDIYTTMIMVSANETFKKVLNPSGEINILAYIASGAAAGALAGALTNPLDVAKTRLQTQSMMMLEEALVGSCAFDFVKLSETKAQCPSRTHCTQLQTRGGTITVPPSCSINSHSGVERAEPVLRRQYGGLIDALFKIKAQEGYAGFFRGVYPRLLVHAPSVAVSWTTFEVLKKNLDRISVGDD